MSLDNTSSLRIWRGPLDYVDEREPRKQTDSPPTPKDGKHASATVKLSSHKLSKERLCCCCCCTFFTHVDKIKLEDSSGFNDFSVGRG